MAVPILWGASFSLVYMPTSSDASLPGNCKMVDVYFATENDIKVISAPAAMFQGTADTLPPASSPIIQTTVSGANRN